MQFLFHGFNAGKNVFCTGNKNSSVFIQADMASAPIKQRSAQFPFQGMKHSAQGWLRDMKLSCRLCYIFIFCYFTK